MANSPEYELHVELHRDQPGGPDNEGLLAAFRFSDDGAFRPGSNQIDLCLPPLGAGQYIETWKTPYPVSFRQEGRVRLSESKNYAFAVLQVRERNPAGFRELVREAYLELMAAVATTDCPHIVKIWNYFDRINHDEEGLERYRQFSWARADVFETLDLDNDRLPTGTAIGTQGGNVLSLVALLARDPFQRFENPRQVSAFHYPERYGPRSPKFSRAGLVETGGHQLFIVSGTAAVVGHQTAHPFDLPLQTEETFNNLAMLSRLAENYTTRKTGSSLDGDSVLRVYMRDPSALPFVEDRICEKFGKPSRNVAFLHGDICRSELEIEIDGLRIN